MASSVFRTSLRFLFVLGHLPFRPGINWRLESENARFIIIFIIFLGHWGGKPMQWACSLHHCRHFLRETGGKRVVSAGQESHSRDEALLILGVTCLYVLSALALFLHPLA